jgi:hypothetical protein
MGGMRDLYQGNMQRLLRGGVTQALTISKFFLDNEQRITHYRFQQEAVW